MRWAASSAAATVATRCVEAELDRWFTQRLGYRLHVNADTARLFKDGFVPERRSLLTATRRPFHPVEYVVLALVLGASVAGPGVISLRDLVERGPAEWRLVLEAVQGDALDEVTQGQVQVLCQPAPRRTQMPLCCPPSRSCMIGPAPR